MTVLMTLPTSGPPIALTAAILSTPYSTAWRTSRFCIAPPAFGLRRLKIMYGKVSDHGQILKLEILEAARPGTDDGLTGVSPLVRSWEPAWMSASWVCAEVTPRVSTIEAG